MRVSSDMPDDVIVLHDALQQIREVYGVPGSLPSGEGVGLGLSLNLKNCGTALRFLQVHIAKCYPDAPITLTGDPRLMERDGAPTSQTTSARILHGEDIPCTPTESPYITLSRRIKESFSELRERSLLFERSGLSGVAGLLEACWSSASYWYEYVAIHGGELLLEGLTSDSLQGDRIVADLYAAHFGVQTTFTPEGAVIKSICPKGGLYSISETVNQPKAVSIDFSNTPDLYPAVALTCEKLSIDLIATGTDRLRYKESDRIEAVRLHEVRNDHRMAMALMAADFPVSENDRKCVVKSYPHFAEIYETITSHYRAVYEPLSSRLREMLCHLTTIKGVNDDNLGKKHALSKLIHAATSEYVWLHDDDVVLPPASLSASVASGLYSLSETVLQRSDLVILPLKMESVSDNPSLLEKLQIAEYAAIQELTMRTAKAGRPVMCSGANLIVRREAWLACEPDLHPEIPSGDDMFLLEAMKKRGYKISVIDEPDYTAVVRPLTSWRAFFRQRMRWAGKAPKYTDPDILRCGALVTLANLLQLLCPLIILIKFPIEYSLIRHREASYTLPPTPCIKKPQTSWLVALLLELVYPFYMLACLIGGLFRQKKW